MTAIERTAYPRFKKTLSKQELQSTYTPTPEEIAFVRSQTHESQLQLNLLVSLKAFQCLGYFSAPAEVPAAVVKQVRQTLPLSPDNPYQYQSRRTMYRHRQLIQAYLQVSDYADGGEAVVSAVVKQSAVTMGDPADLINVALEELIRQRFELPAFSTLDRLVNHLQTQVDDQVCTRVANLLSQDEKDQLDQLLILTEPETKTPYCQDEASAS